MSPLPRTHQLLILFQFLACFIWAQGPHPAFRNYTTDQGLPSTEVYEVLQDRRGYLWFGTDNGVSRFNGYEFENFGPEQGLINNVVFYLHEDHWGRIWMITFSENLYYYDYDQDSILAFPYNALLQKEIRHYIGEMGFYVDSLQNVYRAIRNKGIIRIAPEGEYSFCDISQIPYGAFLLDLEQTVLFSYKTIPRKLMDTIPRISLFHFNAFEDASQKINDLYQAPNSITTATPNFYTLQQGYQILYIFNTLYLFQDKNRVWSQFDPDFKLSAAYQAENQNIFLGGLEVGFRRYANLEALMQNRYTSYLPGNTISHVIQDREGAFWLTSTQKGAFFLPDWNFSIYDQSSGLPDQNVTAITIANDSLLFFALKNGALFELNTHTRQWHPIPAPGKGEIPGLYWDTRFKRLFIPSATELFHYNPEVPNQLEYTGWLNLNAKKFQLSKDGQNVNISANRGFARLSLPDNTVSPKIIGRLFDIHEDQSGRLLIGRQNGLFEYKNDTLVQVNLNYPDLSSRIEEIDEFADGRLVFGTKGKGVIIWDGVRFQNISEADGLTSSMIERLHIDADENLWVGTQNGLNKVRFLPDSTFNVQRFTVANGLPSNEINDIQTWGDQVWIATSKGLVNFPKNSPIQEVSKPPIIEQFLVNGAALPKDSLIRLSYKENNIQISFLTLDFNQYGQINYRYRLLPNTTWTTSRQRTVDLLSLSPGNYTFEVQSQNKDGVWSDPARVAFYIQPPFWQQIWFWLFVALLATGIAYLYYRQRVNRLKEEVALQKQLAEKEREMNNLQRSALRAQMNPHFLSNCMNTIQSFIAKGEKLTAMRYLSNFNRLLRRALDYAQVDYISLEEEIQLLKDYIDLERMRFGDRFQYHISVDEQLNLFDTEIPPMLIQPFVENAILHAFPDDTVQPEIDISYQKEANGLLVTITDNGIGISESKRRKASAPAKKRKSYGMGITERRLKLMNNEKQEPVTVEEWKDEKGNIGGTRVSVLISP